MGRCGSTVGVIMKGSVERGGSMQAFSYQVRTQGPVCIVEASGDVDMSAFAQLTEVLLPLVAAGDVVLDRTG